MHKNKDVGRRILGFLLAICMIVGVIPPIPASAAEPYTVRLWVDEKHSEVVSDATYAYTGEEIRPCVEVIDNSTSKSLTSDQYIVQYENNEEAGTATVKVVGVGSYDFTLEKTFTINEAYIDNVQVVFENLESGVPYCFYNNAGAKPKITKVRGGLAGTASYIDLVEGIDYDITYANNTEACVDLNNASCPYLKVSLKGNYAYSRGTAEKTVYYRIYYNMENVEIADIATQVFNGGSHTPSYTATNKNKPADTVSCDATWSNNINAGTATLTLVGKDKYKGSVSKDFTISPAQITTATVTFDQTQYDYTGTVIPMENHVTVKLGDYVVPATNYSLTYTTEGILGNNILTIVGKNNLTGKTSGTYQVISRVVTATLNNEEFAYTGSKLVPTLSVVDGLGNLVSPENYAISYYKAPESGDDLIYDDSRRISAPTEVGTYYIKVEGTGVYVGTLGTELEPISFRIVPKKISVATFMINGNPVNSESTYTVAYDGTSKFSDMQKVTITDGFELEEGTDYTLVCYKDKACTELLTAQDCIDVGTYYIDITGLGSYEGSKYLLTFTIGPKRVYPTVTVAPQIYTGKNIVPDSSDIKVTADGVAGEITEYTVSCSNNINVGIATITITLEGNLTGTVTSTFEIQPRKISECTISPEENNITVTYNGEVQKPAIEIWDGSKKLVEGVSYEVNYYNNAACRPQDKFSGQQNVGVCYVKITGLGVYANADGFVTIIYRVAPKPLTSTDVTFTAANKDYTESPVEPELTVKDGKNTLVEGTDYEVVGYYKDEACTKAADLVSGRVFVKIKGKGNYDSAVTRVTDFYIGNDVSELVETIKVTDTLTYNRSSQYDKIVNSLVVYDTAGEIVPEDRYLVHFYSDKEYKKEITVSDNELFINAGTVYIGIEGQKGYYGYFYGSCTIGKRTISAMDWSVGGNYTYTGSDIRLEINDGTDLTKTDGIFLVYPGAADGGGDYTLTASDYKISQYKDNRNAGTATVTITGQGNYTGTQTVLFKIKEKDLNELSNLAVTVKGTTYTSRKQVPHVVVTYGDDETALAAGTDFTIEYYTDESYSVRATDDDLTNAGTVYVKITGMGNYKSELSTETLKGTNRYVIAPREISETVVSLEGGSFVYSDVPSSSKIPDFTVKYQYSPGSFFVLDYGTDFTYTPDSMGYSIGEQTLDIHAVSGGNFTGDKSVKYCYLGNMKNDAGEVKVEGIADSVEYTDTIGQRGHTFPSIVVSSVSTGNVIDKSCYEVEYVSNKAVGTATVNIKGKKEKYWTGTYTQTFKITGSVTEANVTIPDQAYTGTAYTADTIKDMQITCHGYTLVKGKDYVIESIDNGLNAAIGEKGGASAPTLTIRGMGDFFPNTTETLKVNFNIKYDLNSTSMNVVEIPDQIYTGSAIEPVITLEYHKPDGTIAALTRDVDYTVRYYNNTEVGAANGAKGPYAVVTATSNGLILEGTRVVPFSIGMVDLENDAKDYRITGVESEYYYTGAAIRPTVVVEDAYGNVLDSKNYTVVCESDSWEAGTTVTVQARGKGNYYGTLTTTFVIRERSLNNADAQVEASIDDVIYNGQAQKPAFKVTFEDYNIDSNGKGKTITLKEGVDFTIVAYYNNTEAGEAGNEYSYASGPYVEIQAVPGRSIIGKRYIPFTIAPKEMDTLYYSRVENPTFETGKSSYEPGVDVKISSDSKELLAVDFDYTVEYHNNNQVAAGNATVGPYIEVKAYSRNFTGTHIIPFSILPKDINGEEFKVELQEITGAQFDAKKWNYPEPGTYTPQVILSDCTDPDNPVDLAPLTDYQVDYANNNAVGTATITIVARGNYAGTRTVKFTIGTLFDETNVSVYQDNSPVTDSFQSVTYNGKNLALTNVTVKRIVEPVAELTEGVDYAITYYTDAECTRPVLKENVVNAGTYYVKLAGLTTAGYIGEIIVPYTIKQKSVNSSDISVKEIGTQNFASGNVRPGVTLYDNSVITSAGTPAVIPTSAYDVTYRNNNAIGTATAIITANEKGNYTGTREVPFNIVRQDISGVTIHPIPDYDYTGSAVLPDPVVYFNGTRLVKGKDYVLKNDPNYGNNTKAGEAWLVLQGIGNYTGVAKSAFKIKANLEKASVSKVENQIYTGKEVRPTVKVVCGGNVLTLGKEYQIEYGENTRPGDAYMIISPTAAYKNLYTGSYLVRFSICDSIEKADITGIPTSQTYTGSKITPEPVVKIGSTILKKNVDYTVEWDNAINVGTATVVVTGIGKYAGSMTATYKIIPKNIARCSSNKISDISYNGKAHTPSVIVRDEKKILARGIDYSISFKNNTKIGTAVISIKGIGNYSGVKKVKFGIVSAPITGLKATSTTKSTKLSWSRKSHITGYEVYTNDARTRITRTTKNSVTLKNLKPGTTYKYKVRTYTVINKKTYYGKFKTITFATKPQTPSVTVTSTVKRQAKISWGRVSGATGYEVYVSTSAKGSYKKVALILKGNTVSYTNKKLKSNKTYYYKVRAYRTVSGKKVYSSYSTPRSIVVK